MSDGNEQPTLGKRSRRWGPFLATLFGLAGVAMVLAYFLYPRWQRNYGHELRFNRAMFGPALAQPIAFSHRLHATDKQIDCHYCHATGERSENAGMPAVRKCLGCHDHIIPLHTEIEKLRDFQRAGQNVPWLRVYYAPHHVFFPHYRHLARNIECRECHGQVEHIDRLHKLTFYMGFCLNCHDARGAARECTACHR